MWLFANNSRGDAELGPGAEQLGPAPMDEHQGGALEAHGLPKLPRAVRTKVTSSEQSAETEYAVSPTTPLLSTEVQENAWVCGDNGRGQLGIAGTQPIAVPQPILTGNRWAALSVGDLHTAGLTCEGQLFTWGANNRGQLGHGEKSPGAIDAPVPVTAVADVDIKAVAVGLEHTVAITSRSVLAWGSNEYGQLGLGENAPEQCSRPTPIKALQDIMITQVACGRFHTICVTAQSQVYAWGHNSAGQLGLGDRRDRHSPVVVDALWALPVVQLAAGDAHSAAVTTSGHMFIWGSNHFGQLGLVRDSDNAQGSRHRRSSRRKKINQVYLMAMLEMGIPKHKAEVALTETGNMGVEVATEWLFSTQDTTPYEQAHTTSDTGSPSSTSSACSLEEPCVTSPKRVPLKGVRYVACGSAHTVAVADDATYSWGAGLHGALGHGSTEDKAIPTRIKALMGKDIEKVACGAHHSLFLRRDGVVYGCGSCKFGQLPGNASRMSPERTVLIPIKLHLPFHPRYSSQRHQQQQQQQQGSSHGSSQEQQQQRGSSASGGTSWGKNPVVHQLVAGGNSSGFITRGPDEIPEVYSINLLEKLQQAVHKASKKIQSGSDKMSLASSLKTVSAGVEMVFGSPAAISAAFGYTDRVGLNVELLEKTQSSILRLFSQEELERAVNGRGPEAASSGTGSSSSAAGGGGGSSSSGQKGEVLDAALTSAIADLHKFSMMQSMYKSAVHLLEDLQSHLKMLHTPERAQVLLAAAQNPLLGEHHFAKALLPRLCTIILSAPRTTRHLLVKWWSEYAGELLLTRVVSPIQSYLTKELMATKKLTISVMNAIKVLAKLEEANQIGRHLGPDGFYNQLISEKMDVQDHYTAWRQTQDQGGRKHGSDGPFSFCSYPFLLDARAKSNLLHIEARFQMEQTVAHARMEQQLYGSSSRAREEEQRVINKMRSIGSSSSAADDSERTRTARRSDDGSRRAGGRNGEQRQGLRGLFFNILRSRFDNAGSNNGGDGKPGDYDSPRSIESQLVRRENSLHLPRPSECSMPGTHSDMCITRIRRNHLVEDALDEIARQYRKDLFKPLRVHFIGEEGIDAGGVKKEFFQLLVAELLTPDYGMLVYQPESNTYWFNAISLEGEEQFMLLGLVLGLAIYNRVLLDFPLPLALYKKLLGQPVGLRELEDMQPMLGRSMRKLLEYDDGEASVEDTFCLTFSVEMDYFGVTRTLPLKPGGEDLPVNEENRHEYVELMVDYLLNKSVQRQFDAFAAGFRILCDGPAIKLFNACEVERLVCGNPNLDFEALERNAKYEGGFSTSTPAVQWLWSIVKAELSLEEKKMFLKFFTGSDRAPIGGLGTLKCIIQRDGPDSNKLPTSHTCFNTLLLPEYSNKERMCHMLKLAVMNSEGFGLE